MDERLKEAVERLNEAIQGASPEVAHLCKQLWTGVEPSSATKSEHLQALRRLAYALGWREAASAMWDLVPETPPLPGEDS